MKNFIRTTYTSPEELLSLLHNIPGVIYRGLPDWSMSFAGEKVVDLTGYTYEEFLSRSVCWRDLIHPEDLGEVRKIIRDAVKSRERSLRIEYRIVRRNKEVRWLADRREMIYNEGGRLAHVDGVLIDRTEQNKIGEALKESEEKYRSIVEQSVAGVYIIQGGFFRYVNEKFCEIFGYSEDEVVERLGPADLTHPEDREWVKKDMEIRLEGKTGHVSKEFRGVKKGGEVLQLKTMGSVGIYRGNRAIMGTLMDISKEKVLEKELLQSQKMEAVGRLTGGIAHDINNYLGAITGFSEVVKATCDGDLADPGKISGKMEEIIDTSMKASRLIDRLLAFSRKHPAAPKVVNLNRQIENLKKMMVRLIREDIEVETDYGEDLWNVNIDPLQFDQIIINLLVNANDSMPEGGKVMIRTGNGENNGRKGEFCHSAKTGRYVTVSVEDTGCGIPEEIREKIFEPFFTTKGVGAGTGLGLSTVYGIVKQYGGGIHVESGVGKGTSFEIYLPMTEEEEKDGSECDARGVVLEGEGKILLVEDNEEVRISTKALLEVLGYEVIMASSGVDALDVCSRGEGVDLVISAVVMPSMNGREFVSKLREKEGDVKVLFMSGYPDDVILRHGICYQGVNFIPKPFSLTELGSRVKELISL